MSASTPKTTMTLFLGADNPRDQTLLKTAQSAEREGRPVFWLMSPRSIYANHIRAPHHSQVWSQMLGKPEWSTCIIDRPGDFQAVYHQDFLASRSHADLAEIIVSLLRPMPASLVSLASNAMSLLRHRHQTEGMPISFIEMLRAIQLQTLTQSQHNNLLPTPIRQSIGSYLCSLGGYSDVKNADELPPKTIEAHAQIEHQISGAMRSQARPMELTSHFIMLNRLPDGDHRPIRHVIEQWAPLHPGALFIVDMPDKKSFAVPMLSSLWDLFNENDKRAKNPMDGANILMGVETRRKWKHWNV